MGIKEGIQVGLKSGFELGKESLVFQGIGSHQGTYSKPTSAEELGFYKGCTTVWQKVCSNTDSALFSHRYYVLCPLFLKDNMFGIPITLRA